MRLQVRTAITEKWKSFPEDAKLVFKREVKKNSEIYKIKKANIKKEPHKVSNDSIILLPASICIGIHVTHYEIVFYFYKAGCIKDSVCTSTCYEDGWKVK